MVYQNNQGSVLAVTGRKIIKYTPTLSQGSCCFKTTYPDKALAIPWVEVVEIQRAPITDVFCGMSSSDCGDALASVLSVCCIMPCFTFWNSQCSRSGLCGFEDSNVRVMFTVTAATANSAASFVDYGPDFRAPNIRDKLQTWMPRTNDM